MNDDWRVQVSCPTTAIAQALSEQLGERGFEHGLSEAAGERVIVSLEGRELFLYAGSRSQAELAAKAAGLLAQRAGVDAPIELRRWDAAAEQWLDADGAAPGGGAADGERAGDGASAAFPEHPFPEYEVRVSTASHHDTVQLAELLQAQGIPSVRRWRYLLIGAGDEHAAQALAERVRTLAPAGSRVEVEATAATIAAEVPPNPFAVFGGLGG